MELLPGAHNLGIDEYQEFGLPIVSFDRSLSENVPIVSSDNYKGGVIATQELVRCRLSTYIFCG